MSKKPQAKRSKGEGTITLRKDGRYEAAITIGVTESGNPKRLRGYFKTQAEARDWLTRTRNDQLNQALANDQGMTMDVYFVRWLDSKQRSIKPKTLASYTDTVSRLLKPQLGHIRLRSLTAVHVERAIQTWLAAGRSNRDARMGHLVLKMALNQAVNLDFVPRNVADRVKPPRIMARETTVWTREEAIRFLGANFDHRLFALFKVALLTGMRPGELLGLRWKDIDFGGGVLHIRQTAIVLRSEVIFSTPKTERSKRLIHLAPDLLSTLEGHKQRQAQERELAGEGWQEFDLVFPTTIGTPYHQSNLAKVFKSCCKRASVPLVRMYDLRHTYASLAIQEQHSLKLVSESLGHTNAAFTAQRYVHNYDEDRKDLAKEMAKIFN